jgi:hypothetical protein
MPPGASVLASLYIQVAEPLSDPADHIYVGEWPTPGQAVASNDLACGLDGGPGPETVAKQIAWRILPMVGSGVIVNGAYTIDTHPALGGVQTVGLFNWGAAASDITVVLARAAFLVI